MELLNILLVLFVIILYYQIIKIKFFQTHIKTITDNAEKINHDQDQLVNEQCIKNIKSEISDPDVFFGDFKEHKEYDKMIKSIEDMAVKLKLFDTEQYAYKKTESESNRTPHELNIIQVGKLEFGIKDLAKSIAKNSKIFNSQISNTWLFIFVIIAVIIFINFFWNKFL
jgi:hypothetical protein